MFTELITVYSEITAEYMNRFFEQNSGSFKGVANGTYMHPCGFKLENVVLAPTNSFGKK